MKRKLSKIYTRYKYLFVGSCLLVLLSFHATGQTDEISSSPLMPVKVVDGDSLEIGTSRIRLTGIDAPEYHQYCKNAKHRQYPCGKKSLEYLRSLIQNNSVVCKIHQKDRYDRYLCTCYTGNVDINAEMVRSGNAVIYMKSPYSTEQQEAKSSKRGIWQGKFMHPRLYRRIKELKEPK